MSKREVIAYAITHAPRGVKGGPYTGRMRHVWTLAEARRFDRDEAHEKCPRGARVIRIVRKARPSEASAMLVTARRRLAAVAEHMTEHAYQEMASALEVDACRAGPSEASAVEVLRELVAYTDFLGGTLTRIQARARRVLAASGPDPSGVVRAAMAYWESGGSMSDGPLMTAVDAFRKAGGTP